MFIECDKMDSDIRQVEKEKYIRAKGQKKKVKMGAVNPLFVPR